MPNANVGYYTGLPSPYPYAWSLLVRAHPGSVARLRVSLPRRSGRRGSSAGSAPATGASTPGARPHRAIRTHYRVVAHVPRPRDLPPHPPPVPPQGAPNTSAWVVIPTYDERENLPTVVALTRAALACCEPPVDGTVLVVDDASPDGTGELADELARNHDDVRVHHRPGKGGLAARTSPASSLPLWAAPT